MFKHWREFLPDFLIIGAQKGGGTTALYDMLVQHPSLVGSIKKEVHYFDNDEWYGNSDLKSYSKQFPRIKKRASKLLFEATPIYCFHPEAIQRIARDLPGVKLVFLLREPASRALSAWSMYHHAFETGKFSHLWDPRPFEQAIEEGFKAFDTWSYPDDRISYVRRGIYWQQYERILEHFPKERVLLLDSHDMKARTQANMDTLTDFLSIERYAFTRQSSNKRKIDNDDIHAKSLAELRSFYEPHNRRLFEMLDKELSWS